MARAIVPSNRNSGIPCPELIPAHVDEDNVIDDIRFDMPIPVVESADPLLALADELMADDGLTPLEAQSQALALLDDLDAYAAVWDAHAFASGNPIAPLPVTQVEPIPIAA